MQLVSTHSTLRNATGGLLPFKTWAANHGLDLTVKTVRKDAMIKYDAEKAVVLEDNRRLMGAVATDARYDVKKFQIVRSKKDDSVIGYNVAGRLHKAPKAEKATKAAQPSPEAIKAAAMALIAEKMGISAEEAAKVLA